MTSNNPGTEPLPDIDPEPEEPKEAPKPEPRPQELPDTPITESGHW
jgi:hypothetical protein